MCIAPGCSSSFVAVNSTLNTTNGCPTGTVLDPNAPGWCNTQACLATSPFDEIIAVDTCRGNLLANNSRVLFNTTSMMCQKRSIVSSTDCRLMNIDQAVWATADPHNVTYPWLGKPFCAQSAYSRVNHLGNGLWGFQNGHNVSMLPLNRDHCILRVRYNITTSDYDNLDPTDSGQVNSTLNSNGENEARIQIDAYHGIPTTDSAHPWRNARGYYFKQNPQVQIFDFTVYVNYCPAGQTQVAGDPTRCYTSTGQQTPARAVYCAFTHPYALVNSDGSVSCTTSPGNTAAAVTSSQTDSDFTLQLAINTNQFGRTFQDRTHTWDVRPRDGNLTSDCNNLFALNVRGKRGNIVQVYPGTEYDFTPNRLHIAEGDCVHFQWTGSNTNPDNNDGQGKEGTDRSNIALLQYIRGQGGVGVQDYGGYGAHGTTWTTNGSQPGWESWMYNEWPTMGDVQCPFDHPHSHPYNWTICTGPVFNRTTGVIECAWASRPNASDGTWLDCANSTYYTPDTTVNPAFCVLKSCLALGYVNRPANPMSWGPNNALDGSVWGVPDAMKHGGFALNHPEHLDNVTRRGFLGMSRVQLTNLAILNNLQLGGNMRQLDDAGTYFDLYPIKVTGTGTYFYMCTRNNNFSNRSQKGLIIVADAPEVSMPVGVNGGVVGISSSNSYVNTTLVNTVNAFDFAVQVPAGAIVDGQTIQLKVYTSNDLSASSDVLFLGPTGVSTQYTFSGTQLLNTGLPQRKRGEGKRAQNTNNNQIWVQIQIVNSTAASFRIFGPSISAFAGKAGVIPTVILHDTKTEYFNSQIPFNSQKELTDTWTRSYSGGDNTANIARLEKGLIWVTVMVSGETFESQILPDPNSGAPLMVKMPVSVTLTNGQVFFWPDNNQSRQCLFNPTAGCNYLRTTIAGATFSNGYAYFAVGASVTTPASGFYQVSPGNDIPLIVGVTAACVCITLVVVISAIYFRKHPAAWAAFKSWGPAKYKTVKRSFASRV